MYYIYGVFGSSLLIESTDSMIMLHNFYGDHLQHIAECTPCKLRLVAEHSTFRYLISQLKSSDNTGGYGNPEDIIRRWSQIKEM